MQIEMPDGKCPTWEEVEKEVLVKDASSQAAASCRQEAWCLAPCVEETASTLFMRLKRKHFRIFQVCVLQTLILPS